MSKVMYLLGAGASYGTRDEKGIGMARYRSGMPIMAEISDCLESYCRTLNYPISIAGSKQNITCPRLYNELRWLLSIAKNNLTIDTYAKQLYVKEAWAELERLKRALSIFFSIIQREEKRDLRYDGFMDAVTDKRGRMRSEVSVLSWNYDHQLEYAFHQFEKQRTSETHQYKYANISCKGYSEQYIDNTDSNLVKLNGMAWFAPKHDHYLFEESDNSKERFDRMLGEASFNANNFISYAWEEDYGFIDKVLKLVEDTEILVIIGYSMPDVNRTVDFRIISEMTKLKSVVIQDRETECDSIKNRFIELLSEEKRNELKDKIRFETNLGRFYVPLSLSL